MSPAGMLSPVAHLRGFLLALMTWAQWAHAADHAVILVYHHVASDTPRSTSVSPATFIRHLEFLDREGFHVWPLSRVLSTLQNQDQIADDVVAITFDDAYQSVFTEAFPLLRERGWPFAVFVATEALDRGYAGYMSWTQLRHLSASGAEVGNHSRTHAHLVRRAPNEGRDEWRERVVGEIHRAQQRIDAEIGRPAQRIFAYPYGEYTRELQDIVRSLGYVGVGQQSGVAAARGSTTDVPRFPVATGFDGPEDFALRVRARPLPVEVLSPDHRVLPAGSNPELKLRVGQGHFARRELACYATGQGRISATWQADEVLVVAAPNALSAGRSKYNCTAPSTRQAGTFYWYSHLWISRSADGGWLAE